MEETAYPETTNKTDNVPIKTDEGTQNSTEVALTTTIEPAGAPNLPPSYGQLSHGQVPQGSWSTVIHQAKPNEPLSNMPPRPSTYLPLTIFNIICCCALLGIFARRSGAQVLYYYERRQYAEAKRASQNALKMNIAGLVIGTIIWIIVIPSLVVFGLYDTGIIIL